MDEYARISAVQLGEALKSSISHAMIVNDNSHLLTTLIDVGKLENISEIQIIGSSGVVLTSSNGGSISKPAIDFYAPECWICHQSPVQSRPRTVDLDIEKDILRVSTPIENQDACIKCHEDTGTHLGILLIDISLKALHTDVLQEMHISFGISFLITLLITAGVFGLVNRLVVTRIESFREPIAAYAAGNHAMRIQKDSRINDEICQLADTFNQMADDIEHYTREQDARSKLRQRAINEERERIVRELHDGIAQVLGYVNTKAIAVRLMLQQGKTDAAEQHLRQLEEAARGVSVDVRDAILGLRIAGGADANLPTALHEYVARFNLLSDLPVQLELVANCEGILPPEIVLHLLRIVQEALSNIRKHARAEKVDVILDCQPEQILLEIRDDGCGFDVQNLSHRQHDQFGLATMHERAKSIHAGLKIVSAPGEGTRVILQVPRPKGGI